MALTRKSKAADTPAADAAKADAAAPATKASSKFESGEGGGEGGDEGNTVEGATRVLTDEEQAAAETAAAGATEQVTAASRSTAPAEVQLVQPQVPVVKKPASALALAVKASIPQLEDILAVLHDNVRVEWNSLPQVQATNGNFKLKEGNGIILGPELHLQLISSQDNFCVTPGTDDPEAAQYVRYSDDGKVLKDGVTPCLDHVKLLQEMGYKDAKCQKRIVLVGEVIQVGKKGEELLGQLVQIDLPPTSMGQYGTYKIQAAWKANKGELTAEQITRVKLIAEPTSAKGRDWTVVKFAMSDVAK